jgi:hypothetical protein
MPRADECAYVTGILRPFHDATIPSCKNLAGLWTRQRTLNKVQKIHRCQPLYS